MGWRAGRPGLKRASLCSLRAVVLAGMSRPMFQKVLLVLGRPFIQLHSSSTTKQDGHVILLSGSLCNPKTQTLSLEACCVVGQGHSVSHGPGPGHSLPPRALCGLSGSAFVSGIHVK